MRGSACASLCLSILLFCNLSSCSVFDALGIGSRYRIAGVIIYDGSVKVGQNVGIQDHNEYSSTTDDTGYFEIRNVPNGSYTLFSSLSKENGSFSELSVDIDVDGADVMFDQIKLPIPVELSPIEDITSDSAGIRWSPSDANDFREYKLYRHGSSGLDESTAQFVDEGLSPYTEYYYRIFVMDEYGRIGGSNIVSTKTLNKNLIWNGDFEDAETDLLTWWDFHSESAPDEAGSFEVQSGDTYEGDHALRMYYDNSNLFYNGSSPYSNYSIVSHNRRVDIGALSGRQYRLSGRIKTGGYADPCGWFYDGIAGLVLHFDSSDSPPNGHALMTSISVPGNADWTYVEQIFTAPEDEAYNFVFFYLASSSEYVWFDNLKLELFD